MPPDARPATPVAGGPAPSRARPSPAAWVALAAALLAFAAAARGVAAARKSLVLDEFHTWYHATRPSIRALFETLGQDNHPPLGFLTVRATRWLCGSSELALRVPALLFGLAELALLGWFGARVLGRRRALAAAALVAASSLHVDFSSQARMYALHALSMTTVLAAGHALLAAERVSRGAQVALGLALAAGFHTHYYGAHYVVAYGAVAATLAARDVALRARLGRFVAPVAAATLVSLPWLVLGFRAQLGHELPPGGDDLSLAGLAEAFVHLFALNVRLGGDGLRLAFIGGGVLVILLALLGTLALCRAPGGDPGRRITGLLLAAGAFGAPCLGWAVAHVTPRTGFTWHYILPSVGPMALLAAAGTSDAPALVLRRAAFALALGLAATLTLLNVRTSGTEDFRSAVGRVLSLHQEGDVVVSVEWQPYLFPQGQPYDYYAPRLAPSPPARVPCTNYTITDPSDLDGASRVLLLRKSLPRSQPLYDLLRERFRLESSQSFGFALDVEVWRRK